MRRARPLFAAAAAFVLAGAAAPATAQDDTFRVALEGGFYHWSNAASSAEAVFDGSAGGPVGGLSAEYGFSRRLFARAGARYFRRTGERAFVAGRGQPVFRLGHPLTVTLVPVYGMVGLRFGGERSSLSPYVGVGGGIVSYKEESDIAGEVRSLSKTGGLGLGVAGLDFGRGTFRFGAEVTYSFAPNVIGEEGVSLAYGENDVGGLSALGRVTIAF
jgi:hypothetical protein